MTDADQTPWRTLRDGQSCRIRTWDRGSGEIRTVHTSTERLYEAPNWTADGRLLVNADGGLWFLPADGSGSPERIDAPGLPPVNNDHVLSPDGTRIYASAADAHIWDVPLDGAPIRRITPEDGSMHFLHGVSPDGQRLAYVAVTPGEGPVWGSATIRTIGVDGTDDHEVTAPPAIADGCEYTPDGAWILLNTEAFSSAPGHAQLARVRPDGGELEQLTDDERVNWFPHIAPTGDIAVYMSFPPGTVGHPADLDVQLRLVDVEDVAGWRSPVTLTRLLGGQGTINVPSWAPDGTAFAFVDYPLAEG